LLESKGVAEVLKLTQVFTAPQNGAKPNEIPKSPPPSGVRGMWEGNAVCFVWGKLKKWVEKNEDPIEQRQVKALI